MKNIEMDLKRQLAEAQKENKELQRENKELKADLERWNHGWMPYLKQAYEELLEKGDEPVSIESVKAVNGLVVPFDCILVENNENHLDNLENLNENPECEENSWIIKVKKQE